MTTLSKKVDNEIMATDIYVAASSSTVPTEEISEDIEKVFTMFRDFESKYSRFNKESELSKLNDTDEFKASPELISILQSAKNYYKTSNGLFDPSILNTLMAEGYVVSKNSGFIDSNVVSIQAITHNFDAVTIDCDNNIVRKPKDLKIDLGGIGKGYIVDKAKDFLKTKYNDFCVDAGGDMYLAGEDKENNYPYWAIELENPFLDINVELPTFLLSNLAVATSGVNKRKWLHKNLEKNHIIDPNKKTSITNNLICTTVIGNNTVFCDIIAKVILILGLSKGIDYCDENNIAGVFITKDSKVYLTKDVEKYVWKE